MAQYLWGNGLVRCNNEYPLTDGRVNVRLTTNASQAITSSSQPDSFGVGSVTSGTASAYGYGGAAGYREEGISPAGLSTAYAFQKVGARYYDQAFGAFLTRDTDLSQKPYAYCDGDPVNFNDPSGHDRLSAGDMESKATAYQIGGAALIAAGVSVMFLGPVGLWVGYPIVVSGFAMVGAGIGIEKAANNLIHNGSHEAKDPPDRVPKGIGLQGDLANAFTLNQDYWQLSNGKWRSVGNPYYGPPHAGPLPPGAIIAH